MQKPPPARVAEGGSERPRCPGGGGRGAPGYVRLEAKTLIVSGYA